MEKIVKIDTGTVNVFLILGKKIVIVDTGIGDSHKYIIRKIEALGYALSDVSLIIITHGHTDHFANLHQFQSIIGTKVAIHAADAMYLRTGKSHKAKLLNKTNGIVQEWLRQKNCKQNFNAN